MKRRRLIALISLCTLLALGILAAVAGVVVMRTDMARNFVQGRLSAAVNGKAYIGRISGNPFTGLVIDTVALRDSTGEMVISSGRLAFDYDLRDLMDSRLYLRHVTVEHPVIHIRQHNNRNRSWNYQGLFRSSSGPKPKNATRSLTDFIVIDSLRARDVTYILSLVWEPDTSFHGARRDSVIRHELARTDRRVERTPDGFARNYIWTHASGMISHARIADPDSSKFGQEIHLESAKFSEFDPPFEFRNVRGVVRRLGDSVWLDIKHWDLPASTGSASGKVWWGSDLPVRYDLVVRGDSVALNDINWVYATLPRTGGGRMVLRMSNRRNLRVMDYHIDSLDVKTTNSRLIGEMTFGVGGPILQLRNVNLQMLPLDFALIKTLNGKPFPIDWRGQIFGEIHAPGGPLTDFQVASARGTWHDTNVSGAVSTLSGSGGLNIFSPAFTEFHDFDVDVASLDLRSIEHLFPAFPKLQGTISGRATLDSIWTDVRFQDADITHRDGPGIPSHFTGSGRITDGSPFVTYDVDLIADPLSFDMLSRSFPKLTLRGLASGPLKIQGQSPDLKITTQLVSAGGNLKFAGNIDIDSLGGYAARGQGEFSNVNLAKLLTKKDAAVTSLNGEYTLDLSGASIPALRGVASLKLNPSSYDSLKLASPSVATVRFDNGRASIGDTIFIDSPIGRLRAIGALGLPGGSTNDSIHLTLVVDSLGGLRPYFVADQKAVVADSLHHIEINGVATGRLDSLLLSGTIASEQLYIRGFGAGKLGGTFQIADALRSPHGTVSGIFQDARIGGLVFDTLATTVNLDDTTHARFIARGVGSFVDTLSLNAAGSWASLAGMSTVRLDSFDLGFEQTRWALEQPSTLVFDSMMFRVDTLGLRDRFGGSIGLAGVVPKTGAVNVRVSAARVPLADIDRVIGQVRAPVKGVIDLNVGVAGTYDAPIIDARSTMDSIAISDVSIGRLFSTAHYANRSAAVTADIFRDSKRVFQARADSLPVWVRFFGYDTLPGRLRAVASADSVDFTLIQAAVKSVSGVTGKVFGNLSLDGSWARPNLVADARLVGGGMTIDTLGITMTNMSGRLTYDNDTLYVDTLRANSGGDRSTGHVTGKVAFEKLSPNWFDLSIGMSDFQAYNRLELATIHVSTDSGDVKLNGTFDADNLTGVVNINRGAIYLPDRRLVGKRFSQATIDGAEGTRSPDLYDRVTKNLTTNLRAHIGGAFKLSAAYADIPLSGDLQIVPVTRIDVASRSTDYISRLAPVGVINADRGTYRIDLFPLNKEFDVQRGGTITFDRDAEWNGLLNVSARYVVRKFGRPEVPIILDVTGRLLTPIVEPRSDASYPISKSDILSYIVFDEPGFDVYGQGSRFFAPGGLLSTLFTPIATSFATSFATGKLKGLGLDGVIDQLRLETANIDQGSGANGLSLLYGTRLSTEKAILGDKVFVGVKFGLCGFSRDYRERQEQSRLQSLGDQIGANLDWRLSSTMTSGATWQLGTEPSTVALLCSPGYTGSQGTAATPRQYSLSFLKFWRW